jgi:hypothetical protein
MEPIVKVEDSFDPRDGVIDDIIEPFGTVADLRDGHAGPVKIEKGILNFLQNG